MGSPFTTFYWGSSTSPKKENKVNECRFSMTPHAEFRRGKLAAGGRDGLDAIENSVALRDHREFFRCGHGNQRIFMTSQLVGGRGGSNL